MTRQKAAVIALIFIVTPIVTVWMMALTLLGPLVNRLYHMGGYGLILVLLMLAAAASIALANKFYQPVLNMWRALD